MFFSAVPLRKATEDNPDERIVELETEGAEVLAVRDNGRGMAGPGMQDWATYYRMQVRRFVLLALLLLHRYVHSLLAPPLKILCVCILNRRSSRASVVSPSPACGMIDRLQEDKGKCGPQGTPRQPQNNESASGTRTGGKGKGKGKAASPSPRRPRRHIWYVQ